MRIKFTRLARTQFLEGLALEGLELIRRDSPAAALRFRKKAEQVLRRLEQFPDSGRKIPEFPTLPHREVIVRPYRFFYRVVGKTVWIVAVWHGAQLPEGPGQ